MFRWDESMIFYHLHITRTNENYLYLLLIDLIGITTIVLHISYVHSVVYQKNNRFHTQTMDMSGIY